MNQFKTSAWNDSYQRGENHIYFPKDETVKFLNRFIKKRHAVRSFSDKMVFKRGNALDYGCGVGRQTILLNEFGFNAYGQDISQQAIDTANELSKQFTLVNKLQFSLITDSHIHFDDQFFDFSICDSVLDSMNFEIAQAIIKELDRVTHKILFITLISAEMNQGVAEDQVVSTLHEQGTIQSYFDGPRIERLLSGTQWQIKWQNCKKEYNAQHQLVDARFHLVLEK